MHKHLLIHWQWSLGLTFVASIEHWEKTINTTETSAPIVYIVP